MKTWSIDIINVRGGSTKKRYSDIITVAMLRATRNTDPEAWADLLRLLREVVVQ